MPDDDSIKRPRPRREERREAKKLAVSNEEWTRCKFYQSRKQRFCNLPRAPLSLFCAHHVPSLVVDSSGADDAGNGPVAVGRKRIPCPFDPSHSIFADEARGHALRCASVIQAKALKAQPFYSFRANAGSMSAADDASTLAVRAIIGNVSEVEIENAAPTATRAGTGALSRIIDSPGVGVDIPALAARLIAWFDGIGDETLQSDGDAVAAAAALPMLDAALLATSRGGKVTTETEGQRDDGEVSAASLTLSMAADASATARSAAVPARAAADAALSAKGKATAFRHELQQVSIVSHLLRALGALDGGDGCGASDAAQRLGVRALPEATPGALAALCSGTVFLELGAGRGGLTRTLAGVLSRPSLVLVDRASVGSKADTSLRREGAADSFTRVHIDLAHLYLRGVAQLWGGEHTGITSSKSAPPALAGADSVGTSTSVSASASAVQILRVAAFGKHLCGGATDLSLRALATAFAGQGAEAEEPSVAPTTQPNALPLALAPRASELSAIAIATCCHHSCSWESYTGKLWWTRTLGASAAEFEVAARLTAWTVLEKGWTLKPMSAAADAEEVPCPQLSDTAARLWTNQLTPEARGRVGRAAKRAIDAGRADFIKRAFADCRPTRADGTTLDSPSSYKLNARLMTFCDATVSLENCLLLAQRK